MQSIPLDNISTVDAAPSSDSARRSTKSEKVVTSNDVEDASPNHNTSVSQEPLVPNGGYGWICVACIFFLNSHTWGINSAYGIFLAHYLSHSTFPGASALSYAFIAGLSVSQSLLIAPLVTYTTSLTSTRTTLLIGILLQTLGLLSASFATQIWHLFLSQGLCFGWGMGFLVIGSAGILPQWFSTRRSLAQGIAASGVGVGGLIYNLATSTLIQNVGLQWTWRILALVSCAVNVACTVLIRDRNKVILPSQKPFDVSLLRQPGFLLLLGWGFFSEMGYVILWFSMPAYAASIGLSPSQGSVVGALLNMGTVVGRPIVGQMSDKLGRINMATVMTAWCGLICLVIWVFATSFGVLCFFAVLAGMVCGTFWSTLAPVGAEVVGLGELPSALSVVFILMVPPATFSEVIALQLRRATGAIYLDTQLFVGFMFVGATAFGLMLRAWKIMHDEDEARRKRLREGDGPHADIMDERSVFTRVLKGAKVMFDWKNI